MITRYVERLAVFEAMRWTPADLLSVGPILLWLAHSGGAPRLLDGIGDRAVLGVRFTPDDDQLFRVQPGNWVVRDVRSDAFSSLDPDNFHRRYELQECTT